MPNPHCWLQDLNVQKQLEDYFADVDRGLSTFYERNPYTAEPQLDGHLAARLETDDLESLHLHLNRINSERMTAGFRPLQLKFEVRHITSTEPRHGADIGLVLRLVAPGEYQLTKAALVQTKRLYPRNKLFREDSSYEELFKRQEEEKDKPTRKLPPQWERLLSLTPSSVYFLYNPHQLRLKRSIPILGTRVVPATYIAGIAPPVGAPARKFTASDAYQIGKPISRWFVEDFICCAVGDPREEIIRTALGRNDEFPVRSTIEITLEGGEINTNLWSQQ